MGSRGLWSYVGLASALGCSGRFVCFFVMLKDLHEFVSFLLAFR